MKKSLIALAVLGACGGTAYADDSTLTLYGIIDAGVLTVNHGTNFNGGGFVTGAPIFGTGSNLGQVNRSTGMMNGGESATRWGIRGSEDMGNGMKAFFQLESGINAANGTLATSALAQANLRTGASGAADTSLNGQLFGRSAYGGISGSTWGALAIGRVTSLQLDTIGGYDPVNAQEFSPINFSGQYGGGGVTDNSRVDNALKYSGKWDAFNFNLVHKFGGIAGASSAQQVNEVRAGWEQGPFGVQASYEMANDTTKLDNNGLTVGGVLTPYPAGTVGVTWVDIRSWMLAAKWQATEAFSVKALYERMQIGAPSNPAVDLAQTAIFGYGIAHASVTAFTGFPDQVYNVYVLGGNYDFTGAWRGSLGYYHVTQNDFSNGSGTAGNASKKSGDDNYVSGMVEYKFSKRTNLYLAGMYNKKSGGIAAGVNGTTIGASTGVTSYTGLGIGLRHVF
jgi:predicted porin